MEKLTGRERFLLALSNQQPDRMPCQVHSWMGYYLKTYLDGIDQYAAYERFGMDPVIYTKPIYHYRETDLSNWVSKRTDLGLQANGCYAWIEEITTPSGILTQKNEYNQYTKWITKSMIQSEADFEIWKKYCPRPTSVDWSPVIEAKKRIGNKGIVRGGYYDFGQGSPWQSFAHIYGTEEAILQTYDDPDWVHYVLTEMLERKLEVIELGVKQEFDLVECGGGAGSSTVISPQIHKEFCLPYDKRQIDALHAHGTKVVYHLCGGLMPLLETVAENGADALETMTPPEMGGDCDMTEANARIGNKLAFIGGFDQNNGFERGTPEVVKEMVYKLFKAKSTGGYICSPSDHFFFGDPANLQAFADAAKECVY
ncbi:MAG: hypothetical protein IJW55_07000 [Clostridia bacterium]|nr:hypothetical protein [Clostridia bacterium]